MLFNKKSEIDDLFDFNGVKMKTFTQWNRLRRGPMERTEIMKNVTLKDVAKAAGVSYATAKVPCRFFMPSASARAWCG